MHVHFTSKVRTFIGRKVLLTPFGWLFKGDKTLRSQGLWAKVLVRLGNEIGNESLEREFGNESPHKKRSTNVQI